MSVSSDFNMLRLEAPRDMLQITEGTRSTEEAVEVANPATWIRTLVRQQRQAEADFQQLTKMCGNAVDHTDSRIQEIERAYQDLYDGTRYVYDRMSANENVAEGWIRSELATAANAYQTFTQQVWTAIIERTDEATQQQLCQATQLARVSDALAFQKEADIARNKHLAAFQGNVEIWATEHQKRVEYLEEELRKAQDAIKKVAAAVPAPRTPVPAWRSPIRPTSTSGPGGSSQPPQIPTRPVLGSPLQQPIMAPQATRPIPRNPFLWSPPAPIRRIRPPALAASPPPLRGPLTGGAGGGGGPPGGPPSGPSTPPQPPSPTPSLPSPPQLNPANTITQQDLIRLVAEGVARAQQATEPRAGRVNTARLKMTNPEHFDGKTTTAFNQWWESVTMFLGFYPDTTDRQRIAWMGTLMTGTALAWHLQRYRDLQDNDTWVNYSAAIRAEYHNEREGADAQVKLGQLRYQGCIRTYMTEFKALNYFAQATGEGLREKVDLAMNDAILDMRFNQNPEDLVDDDQFLQATYRAGIQVEKKKALKGAREAVRNGQQPKDDKKKDGHQKPSTNKGQTEKTGNDGKEPRHRKDDPKPDRKSQYNQPGRWASKDAALTGVPAKEKEEYGKSPEDCWRCGRSGHRTYECFSFNTKKGTTLPPAPWKAAAVREKRKRTEEPEERPAAKQQKVSAVEGMITDQPLWADSEDSDF